MFFLLLLTASAEGSLGIEREARDEVQRLIEI